MTRSFAVPLRGGGAARRIWFPNITFGHFWSLVSGSARGVRRRARRVRSANVTFGHFLSILVT
eukprot:4087956-Pyramimonas_sp.AAC.1